MAKRGGENMFKNKPGPRRAAKSMKNPSSLFQLFHGQNDGKHCAIYKQKHANCNRQIFRPF